ncbi:MAG: hypothetical protein H0X29_02170 [Parachlamydiaceae bacterium]|nr:hypothetical protein [Parachlamydiaceae bacterium]
MFTSTINNQILKNIIPSKEIENSLEAKKPRTATSLQPAAQRIFKNTNFVEIPSKIVKCVKNETPKIEHINNVLTEILSDHFQVVINYVHHIFNEALKDKDTGPLLAFHISTLLKSKLFLLPPRFDRFVSIALTLLPKNAESHSLVLLSAINKLIDIVFKDKELKAVSIALFVEMLNPIFSPKNPPSSTIPEIEIPEKQKMIIGALIQGLDAFFKDLLSSMHSQSFCFELPDFNALHRDTIGNQTLEESLVDKMNSSLRQKGLLNPLPQSSDKIETGAKLSQIHSIFMNILPNSSVSPKEKEAIAYIAALGTSKCAEVLFSPRMMLYLIEMLINLKVSPLPDSAEKTPTSVQEVTAPSFSSSNSSDISNRNSLDPNFEQVLDTHLQNLVLNGARLGTVDISSRITLISLLRSILLLGKGQLGKSAATYMHDAAQSSDWSETLDSIYNFLYQTSGENDAASVSYPALKKLYMDSDESIEKKRENIEQLLKAGVPFEKINSSIKNYLGESNKTAHCWSAFNNHSNILKSFCGNLSNSLYLISQREKLMQMLSSYLIAYTHQALRT